MLDYRLTVFRAVAEKLNFTRAAEVLHISQPAVTKHIHALEEHYGAPLFVRAAAGITLTDAGQQLLAATQHVTAIERQIETRIRSGKSQLLGPLRIGASTTIAQYLLPAMLGRFQQIHPKLEIILRIGNTRDVADAVRAGRLDLGLTEGPIARRDLHSEPFFKDELICIAAQQHPLATRPRVTIPELAATPLILREPGSGTREVVEQALAKAGLPAKKLNPILETDYSETIKGLVATGAGVAFLSRLAVVREITDGTLRAIQVSGLRITRAFSFLYPQGPKPTGVTGMFMDHVITCTKTIR